MRYHARMRDELTDCHLNLTEAARYLSVSPRWLQYQLVGLHPPPAYKLGKCWRFKKSELDRWMEQFRAGANVDKIVNETVAEVLGG